MSYTQLVPLAPELPFEAANSPQVPVPGVLSTPIVQAPVTLPAAEPLVTTASSEGTAFDNAMFGPQPEPSISNLLAAGSGIAAGLEFGSPAGALVGIGVGVGAPAILNYSADNPAAAGAVINGLDGAPPVPMFDLPAQNNGGGG